MAHNYGNPISVMEQSIYESMYMFNTFNISAFDIYQFPQTWGSTALGFGGMGGQAISTAYTTVVIYNLSAVVFFNGRLAYKIDKINKNFRDDLQKHLMKPIGHEILYKFKEEEND